jgi:hypothetical protein
MNSQRNNSHQIRALHIIFDKGKTVSDQKIQCDNSIMETLKC